MSQKLEVGQTLWYVPADSRYITQSREVVISKIGRQWAQIEGLRSDMRISLEDWSVDGKGYPSPGRCWESREAWQIIQTRNKAYRSLEVAMRSTYRIPAEVTADRIGQAASLLGIDLKLSQ